MASISIKCEDENMQEVILYKLQLIIEELKEDEGYQVDMNYDVGKHGARVIKVKRHENTEE